MRPVVKNELTALKRPGQTTQFGRFLIDCNLVASSGQAISAGEAADPASDNGNIFHVHLLAILRRELRAFRNGNIFRTLLLISATTFFLAVAAQNRNTRVSLPAET
jgi:hypothetical protein